MPRRRRPLFYLRSAESQTLDTLSKHSTLELHFQPQRQSSMLWQCGLAPSFRAVFCGVRRNSNIYCITMFLCVVCQYCAGGSHSITMSPLHRAEATGEKMEYPCQNRMGGVTPCGWGTPWSIHQGQPGKGNNQYSCIQKRQNPEGSLMRWVGRTHSGHCY